MSLPLGTSSRDAQKMAPESLGDAPYMPCSCPDAAFRTFHSIEQLGSFSFTLGTLQRTELQEKPYACHSIFCGVLDLVCAVIELDRVENDHYELLTTCCKFSMYSIPRKYSTSPALKQLSSVACRHAFVVLADCFWPCVLSLVFPHSRVC
jgi:hypothetical protein